MSASRITSIATDPSTSHPNTEFDLTVAVSRPLGGTRETIHVPVKCRDAHFNLSPHSASVQFDKDATSAEGTVRATITGSFHGAWVELLVEGTLNGTETCMHRLEAIGSTLEVGQ